MNTYLKIDDDLIGKYGMEMAVVAAYIYEHENIRKPSGINESYVLMAHRVGLSPYKLKIALAKLTEIGLISCTRFTSKSAPIIKIKV